MAGCGWILGLDEFTDQPPPGNAGGGGSGGECVSVADCPGGEHGKASCDGGACGFVCDDGFDDCDTELGCETATSEDKANCGGCGISCSVYCTAGSCNDPIDATVSNNHACAILMSGSAWCWGQNNQGELGDGTTIGRSQPVNVVFPARVIQIEADGDRSCALLTDRTVWCWGFNGQGQLGIGTTAVSVPNPTPLPLIDIQEIALGLAHTCALDMSNRLFCWGSNDRQQVGNDSLTNALSPVQVAESVASVSLGARHTCAVKLDGRLACWGDNLSGQLGLGGSDTEVGIPVTLGSLTDAAEIACGGFHTCARTAAGVRCWGSNQYGQLGMGSMTDFNTPQQLDLANVTALSMGPRESGALVADKQPFQGSRVVSLT
jgi:alpha-tubulin suppressor-like RCC1 family protein